MFKLKPFPFSLVVLALLVILHLVGSNYSWYWIYPWFDTLVHIVSGLWVALVFLWLSTYLGQIDSLREYKVKSFLIALISAVLIGVVWEILENFSQTTYTRALGYGLDTALDILSDALGGVLAYLYFVKRRRCRTEPAPNLHPFYTQVRSN